MVKKDVTIPQNQEELEEALHDGSALKWLSEDPDKFKGWVAAYAKKADANDPDMKGQIKAQMNEVLTEFYDKNEVKMPEAVKRLPMDVDVSKGTDDVYKKLELTRSQKRQIAATGEGPGVDAGEFDSFVDFARGISPHVTNTGLDARLKVLGEGQGDQGGFLVPEEFRAEMLSVALEAAVVRPRARVLPMSTLTVRVPSIRDTTDASNVFGGVTGYWVPESGSFTQSEPTFSQTTLTAKKLIGGTRVANELLRDSAITLEPLLNQLFADAIAYFEDDAFIAGIGGGQPLGILNADALVSVTKETGQAATTLSVENVIKAYSRLLPGSIANSVWIMHPDVQPQLYTMSLAVGTGGAPMFFPAGGISGAPTPTLLGRPIIFSEKAETLGSAGDVYLADLSYYLIGDRQALEMASSPHVRFNTDETDFRFIERIDGRPWIDSAITPRNGSNTLSPFVAIAARA